MSFRVKVGDVIMSRAGIELGLVLGLDLGSHSRGRVPDG